MTFDPKKIIKGRVDHPYRYLVYGTDGIGKTGFAAGAPDPFFIDANSGSLSYDVQRAIPDSWEEAKDIISAVESGRIPCKTLVLDSLTDLEAMSHKSLFKNQTIDEFGRGYGQGENVAIGEWRTVLAQLERIWNQGKSIVIVAHAQVKAFDDPTGVKFDRFEVAARPKLAGLIRQWCDHVLFCREEIVTALSKGASAKVSTNGTRWMYTSRTPSYDAKARGPVPWKVLLSWKDFAYALRGVNRTEDLQKEVEAMLVEISDAKLTEQVLGYMKNEPTQLVESHNRVTSILERHRAAKQQEGVQQA